ncbi:hypothetical protein L6164_029624 [Bauhinia variegata]|uniref:Uncharacterized protein n=1 Tax=Bauhinia variegata TaxID=167791 RepID=A0ACB9LA61_BAUVA|nr:hypothetical protein L6164_029624 [Bauhinia variegata]
MKPIPLFCSSYHNMNEKLKVAALEGITDWLYAEIEVDPYVLDGIDEIPFVETPLHQAASSGRIGFATEIMRLKPSFCWKLNQQGESPMHLALQNRHYKMVSRFVDINKDLVRVKGKDGITPLHMVSKAGEIGLLAEFLLACPESIRDVTIQSETALHVAVKSGQFHVLDFLVRWLQYNCDRDAGDLQKSTLNWKDDDGNAILHILVGLNDPDLEIVKLLLRCKIDLNAKNYDQSTALDIVENRNLQHLHENIRDILISAGGVRGASVSSPTLEESLPAKITMLEDLAIKVIRNASNIRNENRNALLAVAVLVGTITCQASLSPPGGVFQVGSQEGSLIHNSTQSASKTYAGKSVMDVVSFCFFWAINTVALLVSIFTISILLPSGRLSGLMMTPVLYFGFVYFMSMSIISPNSEMKWTNDIMIWSISALVNLLYVVSKVSLTRLRRYRKNWEIKSRFPEGNRW